MTNAERTHTPTESASTMKYATDARRERACLKSEILGCVVELGLVWVRDNIFERYGRSMTGMQIDTLRAIHADMQAALGEDA
jgi:hypothetical protein